MVGRHSYPIITRFHPVTAKLQVVVKLREDVRENMHTWALPGGFVNPGEDLSENILRVIKNQAGLLLNDVHKKIFNQITDELFADGKIVYRGYVDLSFSPRPCKIHHPLEHLSCLGALFIWDYYSCSTLVHTDMSMTLAIRCVSAFSQHQHCD